MCENSLSGFSVVDSRERNLIQQLSVAQVVSVPIFMKYEGSLS
jgi:hypothetical protein